MEYATYINSNQWRSRRKAFLKAHGNVCRGCGTKDQLHVHHRTYDRMGEELDSDLCILCEACHTDLHQRHRKSRRPLEQMTDSFLKMKDEQRGLIEKIEKKRKGRKAAPQRYYSRIDTLEPVAVRSARHKTMLDTGKAGRRGWSRDGAIPVAKR